MKDIKQCVKISAMLYQDAEKTASDILDCAISYIQNPDGLLPRKDRPATLQPSILGRIPPT